MTSVEKRRSSRRSRGHRKHSNGGFSNASSGGSYLDETDREVSNLTDRAFRSLCIGDEAVYNDSDLSLSSPSTQRDRQLAFCQDGDIVERDREEQKRAEQENFNLRVQQYGQDWIFGGMGKADIHRDPQWEVYGERTQGMVSATFQHSFVETSQQQKSLREQELSLFSNGASEFSSQQRRSRSRVSSLVKAFNSDGHGDGAEIDDKLREWSDGTGWDRSALMSIQRELSEFSTSYQQNFDGNRFPSASPFSPRNTNFFSSQMGAMTQMSHNSASAYIQAAHIKHSMAAQVNSNFFMHSEYSPFRLWRDHNRFPFHQGELSGFMQCSEFPKWYQTPMYNELSYKELRHQRNTLAPAAPSTRSISTSTVLQKSSAVEKRCESELACHYPHRKWTQNLGTNKLPTQRPSTASPTTEMSRRVRDTISSVKALQQKVKMVSEQNITTNETASQQGVPYGREHLDNPVNRAVTVEPNVFSSNTRSSFGTSQLLAPLVYVHQEAETSNFHHCEVSPQPVEHPPVRAESRGVTPDVRMSSYKSRATSLLFNLKDNRKRVKSTYSPTKFKSLDTQEQNKQEPHETAIDTPVLFDPDIQSLQLKEPRRTNAAVNQYHSSGLKTQICKPERTNTSQYPENTSVQTQGQMVHHTGFSSFIPENYPNYQLANGQNPYENVASFTPHKQDYFGSLEQLQHPYSAVDTARLNTDNNQSREYLISKANSEQAFNETVGGVSSKVTRYEQLIENKQNYKNASSLEKWRQTNSQDTENVSLRTDLSSSKQDMTPLTERPRVENQSSRNKDVGNVDWKESLFCGTSSLPKADLVCANVSNQLGLEQGQKTNEIKDGISAQKNNKYTEQDGKSQNNLYCATEKPTRNKIMGQVNQFPPVLKEQEMQSQQLEVKPQFEIHKNSSNPENLPSLTTTHQIKDRKATEIKSEQATAENAQDSKAEETKTESTAVQPLKTNPAEFISIQKTGSENIRTEEFKLEPTKLESPKQVKKEQIKKEERTGEQKEPGRDEEKKTKSAQTRVQHLTDEPKHSLEKTKYEHMTEEQVKAEQAESEKLKGEHIKNKLAKTEEVGTGGIKQAEVKKPTRKITNPEHVKEEQLIKEQAEGEQMEAEQVKTENINPEKVETEHRKAEQSQQVKELQSKAKYIKIIEDEMIESKTDLIKVEGAIEVEKKKDFSHVGQITAEKPTTSTCLSKDTNPAERKPEPATLRENKLDRCRAELSTTENLLERSDHLTAKLTAAQHARREPDKVEQVKTELAKAKAELAKIKEKMRGEQKEKVKNNPIINEDGASKSSIPLSIGVDKNKNSKKQDQSFKTQTHSGADDYERLREKYGFTNATETNKMLTGITTSAYANTTDNTPVDEAETNNAKINSLACLFTAAKAENKKEVSNKHKEVTETDTSKEFKLSGANYSPINSCNKTNGDTSDKLKYDSGQKLEKYDSVNNTISQQRDSDLDKLLPLQRKPESNEHSADLSVTPPRALSQKERAQAKQEILTSKIKAHAEKEISAIKEKGFALRDGFIGKSSTKHLSGQSVNIRQRPSSLEVPKNHENTVSNNASPKLQIEPLGIQTRPAKFAPPQSCAAITGKPAASTSQLENLEKPANQTANRSTSTAEDKIPKEDGINSLVQSKEKAPKNNEEKERANHSETSAKQKDELEQKVKKEIFSEKKEDRTQDAGVEAVNIKPVTCEAKNKETPNMDSAPLNVIDSNEMTITDDSLQIMGIVVTVRERKPSESITQTDITNKAETEKECNKSVLGKDHPSQVEDGNKALKEAILVKEMDVKKAPSVVKEDLAKVVQNNYTENVPQASSLETKKKHVTKNITEKRTDLQQDSFKANPEPKGETQSEPTTEKGASFSVTAPTQDKMLTETQTVLCQQNTTADKPKNIKVKTAKENLTESSAETKKDKESNQEQTQTAHINNNFTTSVVNSKTNNNKDDSSVKQLSVKEDDESFHQSSNIDGQSAPLHKETKEKSFNKLSPNESLQLNEKLSKGDITDVNVHIDRIAIRVVPAETKNYREEVTERRHSKAFQQQNVSSSWEEKANTSNNEPCSKGFTLTRSEQKEESLEEKLAVQNVLSSVRKLSDSLKASKQSTNTSSESCKAENKRTESNIQPVEGDYFQIQRDTETSSEAPSNITSAEDKLNKQELPELLPNFTAISNESCKEIKSDVFVFSLDQSDKKASSENIQDENIKKKHLEREDSLSSNQTDASMERWNKREKGEAGQLDSISKSKEERLHLSTMERRSSKESQPTKTNPNPEKSEVKQKPKGRTSRIPEISALADYARLKVIVAEDKDETTALEFPPNKKEGFFPLIHTRHSRPPVFTDDPQNYSAKEKKLPNKTETSAKVKKEPKSIVFPKMEKEHQRTGMFKLGDKEKQEKMGLDAKVNVGLFKNKDKDSSQKETNKSSTQTEQLGQESLDPSTKNPQVMALSFAGSRTNNNSSEELTYLHPTLGQMHHETEHSTNPEKNASPETQDKETRAKAEDGRIGGRKQETLTTQSKETKTKQQDLRQQSEEEAVSRDEKEQNQEDIRIKNMIEERRASLAEEERRATRREEERRAREREAVAIMIKERREKQRQAEIKAENEGQTKKRVEEKVQNEEEIQTKQKVEATMTKTDKRRIKTEDERVAKLKEKENKKHLKQQKEGRDAHEEQQRRTSEEQRKDVQAEQRRRLEQEEHRRKAAQEEHQKGEAEENKRRAALKEQQRKNALEEQQRRAAQEEQQRKFAEEQQRRAVQEEQQRRAAQEEQQRRAAQEEQQRRAAQEEQQRKFAEEQQRRAAQEEQQRRAAQEEQQRKFAEEQQRRAAQEEQQGKFAEEQQRRAAQEEQQRKFAEEQQRRAAQEEQQGKFAEEQQRKAAEEQQRRAAQEEQQRKFAEEQQRRAAQEEQQGKFAEEQQRKAAEEQQRRAAQEEQQGKFAEEQQRKAAEEQQRRAAQEEQQKRAAQEEQERRAAQEEQQRKFAKEQQRRAAEEQQRRAAQEEQQRKFAEEQQRRAAEEQQRRVAHEEQQRRDALEEIQKRAALEEQWRRAVQEERQRNTLQEEQQRKASEEEQQRISAEEQQRRAAQEEQQRRAAQEEQQKRAAQKEQQRRATQEEQQRKFAEEQQRRAAQKEQHRRDALEEQQRRVAQEEQQIKATRDEQQRRDALEEQQRRAAQDEKHKRALNEQQRSVEEERWRKAVQETQQRRSALIEEQRHAKQNKKKIVADLQEEMEGKPREEKRPARFSEEEIIKLSHVQDKVQQQTEEQREAKHQSSTLLEKNTFAQESMLAKKDNDAQAEKKEDEKEKARCIQVEKQQRAAQKMDALQYYALTSTDTEKKLTERQLSSPSRPNKPNTVASPAPPLPRSNTSSPALGVKPLMFRVKDNTFRGSSFTKSVKPRFHKNFGEDFWMGSPSDRASDRAEDDQETTRRSAGTPVSPEKGPNQFAPIGESANFLSESSSQDYSTAISHQRPYSRRSMAMDEDESRSVISSMSEDVESFATSAADVADVRGLSDYDRPESACSVSSDVSRSLGKPPTVPPKSEKALRRAQRLTSHRIKKELAKAAAGAEKEASTFPSSTEVCSSNRYAVASPHFSAPVAFAHAPTLGPGLPSSHAEHPPSHHSFHASPHATGPISLPMSSPHAGSTSSLPSVSHHASGKASKPAAPKTVAHVSSSPTPHLTNPHSAPVTQYQVESSPYHQAYPLTQRKVLQDLGSGQYFLVDVPVQVKTKTFFDPETGKYVQLNVRRSQPQQTYPQAHLQPQQPLSQASFPGKPFVFYQGYHRYPQSHQPAVINSAHPSRLSGPPALQQQPGESNSSTEVQQDSEGHLHSPEKTNYMDTVNDVNRIHNTTNNSQDSNDSECNSNNQLTESSVCENDKATNSRYQPRDIIAMSELEDFMEVSDW